MTSLTEHIATLAEPFCTSLKDLKSAQPGHNGPHKDPETPVRNSAHWLVTLTHLYDKTLDVRYKDAANILADYLCSDNARPMNASFWCRKNPKKDFSNGLMGQAWAIEGLIAAAKVLNRQDCYDLAMEVFLLHPFDESKSIWHRVNVDGSISSPDGTFNHQLWFAAITSFLKEDVVQNRVNQFFENVGQHVTCYNNGVVYHNSRLGIINLFNSTIRNKAGFLVKELRALKSKRHKYSHSIGYHGFNIYAYALLYETYKQHKFWNTNKWKKMLGVINTDRFYRELNDSKYGWPYNPPGLEFAYTCEVFFADDMKVRSWLERQVKHTFCKSTNNLMSKNSPDVATSTARIYEATRLNKEYTIPI